MGGWLGDVRYGLRHLAQAPGFVAAAVGVLALGIGLNAGMFGVVYAIAFAGRAFPEPDRLVQIYSSRTTEPDSYRAFSYPAYERLADSPAFSGISAYGIALVGVADGGETRRTFAALVSAGYFDVLGVPLALGRGFSVEESRPGADVPVAVVTYTYWQRHGFDSGILGTIARVNGRPFTIVGVGPRGFTGSMSVFGPELFFPLGVFHSLANDFAGPAARRLERADAYSLFVVGRLAPGVTTAAAESRLRLDAVALAEAMPAEYRDARLTLAPLPRFGSSTSPDDEGPIALLGAVMLGLTGAVLLTVCLNLAAMLLARGRARRKELAIRLALGGARARLVRQLLIEGALLSVLGGLLGTGLAAFAVQTLQTTVAAALPLALVLDGLASPIVIAATLGFCGLATVWFALVPALRHTRGDLLTDLKAQPGEDVSGPPRRFVPGHPLAAAQVALSLCLLIAAGLFVRMAETAMAVNLGFDADQTVLAEVDHALAGHDQSAALAALAEAERRLGAVPGVQAVGTAAVAPLGMIHLSKDVARAGVEPGPGDTPATPDAGRAFETAWNGVSAGYFAAMGVRLLAGRTFSAVEAFDPAAPPVVVLDEVLAARLWPDGGALGQLVRFRAEPPDPTEFEVIGIVSRTTHELFATSPPGAVYAPLTRGPHSPAFLHVRPAAAVPGLPDLVRDTIRTAAPGVPIFAVRTFRDHVEASLEFWALRRSSLLFGASPRPRCWSP